MAQHNYVHLALIDTDRYFYQNTFVRIPLLIYASITFRIMKTIAIVLTVSVIGINLFFVAVYIQTLPSHWWIYTIIAVLVVLYMLFVIYLVSEY